MEPKKDDHFEQSADESAALVAREYRPLGDPRVHLRASRQGADDLHNASLAVYPLVGSGASSKNSIMISLPGHIQPEFQHTRDVLRVLCMSDGNGSLRGCSSPYNSVGNLGQLALSCASDNTATARDALLSRLATAFYVERRMRAALRRWREKAQTQERVREPVMPRRNNRQQLRTAMQKWRVHTSDRLGGNDK